MFAISSGSGSSSGSIRAPRIRSIRGSDRPPTAAPAHQPELGALEAFGRRRHRIQQLHVLLHLLRVGIEHRLEHAVDQVGDEARERHRVQDVAGGCGDAVGGLRRNPVATVRAPAAAAAVARRSASSACPLRRSAPAASADTLTIACASDWRCGGVEVPVVRERCSSTSRTATADPRRRRRARGRCFGGSSRGSSAARRSGHGYATMRQVSRRLGAGRS